VIERNIFSEILYYNIILYLIFLENVNKDIDGKNMLLNSFINMVTSKHTTNNSDS
jgi:hypothetical protein